MKRNTESGQSLIEVLIGLVMAIVIVGALINIVVSSLRNSQSAKTAAQATKYAQEGIEIIRTDRDRSANWESFVGIRTPNPGANPWCLPDAGTWIPQVCNSNNIISGTFFTRDVTFEVSSPSSVMVTVVVKWADQTGSHKSQLSTLLSDTSQWH